MTANVEPSNRVRDRRFIRQPFGERARHAIRDGQCQNRTFTLDGREVPVWFGIRREDCAKDLSPSSIRRCAAAAPRSPPVTTEPNIDISRRPLGIANAMTATIARTEHDSRSTNSERDSTAAINIIAARRGTDDPLCARAVMEVRARARRDPTDA